MATSKDTRRSGSETNPFFRELFKNSAVSQERERAWQDAVRHAGTGTPPLRFPAYEHLYLLNVYAQKLVELLEELSSKFAVCREYMPYCQSLVQYVRATVSVEIAEAMAEVEETEAWLFQSQQRKEEDRLRDPDDVYISVRQREVERINQGLPPRIQFLDQPPAREEIRREKEPGSTEEEKP